MTETSPNHPTNMIRTGAASTGVTRTDATPTDATPTDVTRTGAAPTEMSPTGTGRSGGPVVTVRHFAAARAAAGTAEETVAGAACLDELLTMLAARHGERMARVLGVASFLVDGLAWHDRHAPLPSAATVDVLPPFAGG